MRSLMIVLATFICGKAFACDNVLKVKITSDNFEQVASTVKEKCVGDQAKLVASTIEYVGLLQTPQRNSLAAAFAGRSIQDVIEELKKLNTMSNGKTLQQTADEVNAWGRDLRAKGKAIEQNRLTEQLVAQRMAEVIKAESIDKVQANNSCSTVVVSKIKSKNDLNGLAAKLPKSCSGGALNLAKAIADYMRTIPDAQVAGKSIKDFAVTLDPNAAAALGASDSSITFKIKFRNLSERNIAAFQGYISVRDKLDNEMATIALKQMKPVDAKALVQDEWTYAASELDPKTREIASTDMDGLKITFVPQKILFSDGTVLGTGSAAR